MQQRYFQAYILILRSYRQALKFALRYRNLSPESYNKDSTCQHQLILGLGQLYFCLNIQLHNISQESHFATINTWRRQKRISQLVSFEFTKLSWFRAANFQQRLPFSYEEHNQQAQLVLFKVTRSNRRNSQDKSKLGLCQLVRKLNREINQLVYLNFLFICYPEKSETQKQGYPLQNIGELGNILKILLCQFLEEREELDFPWRFQGKEQFFFLCFMRELLPCDRLQLKTIKRRQIIRL